MPSPMILLLHLTFLFSLAFAHEQPTHPEDCSVGIVGAGLGGAYTAWRLAIDTRTVPASKICIFEAKTRPGGRILSIDNPVPGFDNFTVDLGGYRYHRSFHRHLRLLTESVLNITTQCYTDPLEREPSCDRTLFNIATARGKTFGLKADGTNAGDALSAYSSDIPYVIPPAYQWGPGAPLDSPRTPGGLLSGSDSIVKEIADRWDDLTNAPDYTTAMRVADEIITAMKNGSYRGIPYTEVSLLQAAVKEGLTTEEIAYYFDANVGVGQNAHDRQNLDQRGQMLVRETALLKDDSPGPKAMVTPIEMPDGIPRRIGMKTVPGTMLEQLRKAGAQIFYNAKVTAIRRVDKQSPQLKISFADGGSLVTSKIFLNVGKPDLVALGVDSEPMKSSGDDFRRSVERTFMGGLAKVYCFWEDAWWLTKLKIAVGRSRTQENIFSIRYHDGHFVCQNTTALTGCRGGALMSYVFGDTSGLSAAIFGHAHNAKPYTPLTNTDAWRRLIPGNMTGTEQLYFDDIHAQLRRVHKSSLAEMGFDNVEAAIPQAAGCIFADWHDVGIHDHMGPGKGKLNMFELFTRPVPDLNISLVNEAWGQVTGWAESSLHSAERALFHRYGLPKPTWMDETFHSAVIVRYNQGA